MLLFDAPEAASPPREDPFHCGSVCVFDLLIQDSRFSIPLPHITLPHIMNAKELLQCAPRLSESNCAYVILINGGRGIIVPPGTFGKKITVRACDADGNQSGPVMKVSPKELRLEPLPAPPAPLRLAPWCVNCGRPAMLR